MQIHETNVNIKGGWIYGIRLGGVLMIKGRVHRAEGWTQAEGAGFREQRDWLQEQRGGALLCAHAAALQCMHVCLLISFAVYY